MMFVLRGPGKVITRRGQSCEVTKEQRILGTWLRQNTTGRSQTHTSDQWRSSQNQFLPPAMSLQRPLVSKLNIVFTLKEKR